MEKGTYIKNFRMKIEEEKTINPPNTKPDPLVESYRELIDILPLKTIDYAFAYGSCIFKV